MSRYFCGRPQPHPRLAALVACAALIACGSGDGIRALDTPPQCNPLGGAACVTPFPSAIYAVDDPTTDTGRRLDIAAGALPANSDGIAIDPAPYNRRDGFSPAAPIIAAFAGGVDGGNLVHHSRYADSLTDESPTVIVDMTTGERVAHFAELDIAAAEVPDQQALYIRPAAQLRGATRYAVAIRTSLLGRGGRPLEPPAGFAAILDGVTTDHARLERARPRYRDIFAALERAGVPRGDLVVAWDFTTASDQSTRADVLAARDRALAEIGPEGANLTYQVFRDQPHDDPAIARSLAGAFDAPLFLTGGGSYDGGVELARDPATGLPQYQGVYRVPLWAIVPACAESAAAPVPIMIFVHGVLGRGDQITGNALRKTAATLCMVVVATDMRGMSSPDIPNVGQVLGDFNQASAVFDALVQGLVNHFALQRIARGALAREVFVDDQNASLVDPTRVVLYGLSQGHIFGSTIMAYDDFITRAVVGVGGANYSLMLERSTNWPTFRSLLARGYPDLLDIALILHLIQMRWDPTDPAGTANDILQNSIPGTPPKQLLLHMSVNDAQVPNLATEWQVRTMGVPLLSPAPREIFAVDQASGPLASGLVVFDGGFDQLPGTNQGPALDNGAHSLTRELPAALRQMGRFYATGEIHHECGATACVCQAGACD